MMTIVRAKTVLEADVFDEKPAGGQNPFLVKSLWGELMSARAMQWGAAGAVVDGYSRDTRGTLALDFPTFSYGCYAQDQAPRGKRTVLNAIQGGMSACNAFRQYGIMR